MTENENLAKARYNMSFDYGSFKKDKFYKYRYNVDYDEVYVITEEGREQDFYIFEFNSLFSF